MRRETEQKEKNKWPRESLLKSAAAAAATAGTRFPVISEAQGRRCSQEEGFHWPAVVCAPLGGKDNGLERLGSDLDLCLLSYTGSSDPQ